MPLETYDCFLFKSIRNESPRSIQPTARLKQRQPARLTVTAPTLRYSLRLMLTPLRRIVSSQITIASEPSGKKCGPRLFPMMLLKISPVKADPVAPMCWMLSKPRIVMGQLFMKLAPTVTTMLGAKIPSADGSLLVATRAEARRFVMPAVSNPCTTMKNAEHEEHNVPVDVPCQANEPFLLTVH